MKPLYLKGTLTPDIPRYIMNIACRLSEEPGPYQYRLRGVNQYRPSYGLYADLESLTKWAEAHFAEVNVIKVNEKPNNYYAIIELTDPVCLALERADLIFTAGDAKAVERAIAHPHHRGPVEVAAIEKLGYLSGRKEF